MLKKVVFSLVVGLVLPSILSAEPPTAEQIKTGFDAAKKAHADRLKSLTMQAARRQLDKSGLAELNRLRQLKTVEPEIGPFDWKPGLWGRLVPTTFVEQGPNGVTLKYHANLGGGRVESSFIIYATPDKINAGPGNVFALPLVYIDRFEGEFAVFKPLELTDEQKKLGSLKP